MVCLIAKRIYNEAIVPVLVAEMSLADAKQKLSELAMFPGQASSAADHSAENELWIEIEAELDGDLIGDPVCFAPEYAHATLLQMNLTSEQATYALSDENAASILKALYSIEFGK